jgi:hypothetical protein
LFENAIWALPEAPAPLERFQYLTHDILNVDRNASVCFVQAGLQGEIATLSRAQGIQ